MTFRYMYGAVTAGVLTCGMAALGPVNAQAQGVTGFPEAVVSHHLHAEGGPITVTGCLQREKDYRRELGEPQAFPIGRGDEYMLVNARVGSVASVPSSTCSTTNTGLAIELSGKGEDDLDRSMVGRVVEISGELDHAAVRAVIGTTGSTTFETTGGSNIGNDNKLREVDVASFRLVPVAVPVAASPEPAPAPLPAPAPEPIPEPAPAPIFEEPAPAPPAQLPRTASPLALTGLLGLLSLGGAVMARFGRRR